MNDYSEAIAAENEMLDRAEQAYAMAGHRGNWIAQAEALRVMSAASSRLVQLEERRDAEARADEIERAIKAMVNANPH